MCDGPKPGGVSRGGWGRPVGKQALAATQHDGIEVRRRRVRFTAAMPGTAPAQAAEGGR